MAAATATKFVAVQAVCDGFAKLSMEGGVGPNDEPSLSLGLNVKINASTLVRALIEYQRERDATAPGSLDVSPLSALLEVAQEAVQARPTSPGASALTAAQRLGLGTSPKASARQQQQQQKGENRLQQQLQSTLKGSARSPLSPSVGLPSPSYSVAWSSSPDVVVDQALVCCSAWSPDGAKLAIGRSDRDTKIWQVQEGSSTKWGAVAQIRSLQSGWITSFAWSPDSKSLVTGGDDGVARVYQGTGSGALSWDSVAQLVAHRDSVWAVAWSPSEDIIATGSADGILHIWRRTQQSKGALPSPPATARSAWTPTGGLRRHGGSIRSIAWAPEGPRFISGSSDATACIWEEVSENKWEETARLEGHESDVVAVSWCNHEERVATASADGKAFVWAPGGDEEDGWEVICELEGLAAPIAGLCFAPAEAEGAVGLLLTGGFDKTIKVWQPDGGMSKWQEHAVLKEHTHAVISVTWSADGKRIACCQADGSSSVWVRTDNSFGRWAQQDLRLAALPLRGTSRGATKQRRQQQ